MRHELGLDTYVELNEDIWHCRSTHAHCCSSKLNLMPSSWVESGYSSHWLVACLRGFATPSCSQLTATTAFSSIRLWFHISTPKPNLSYGGELPYSFLLRLPIACNLLQDLRTGDGWGSLETCLGHGWSSRARTCECGSLVLGDSYDLSLSTRCATYTIPRKSRAFPLGYTPIFWWA